MRRIILRHDEQARRHAVDPVHDAGPQRAAYGGKRPEMVQQPVDERTRRVPRRRMHHKPLRLVDHADVRILIDDVERHVLRYGVDLHRVRYRQQHLVPGRKQAAGARRRAVDLHRAFPDQPLHLIARQAGGFRQKAVEPPFPVRGKAFLTHGRMRRRAPRFP